MIEIIKAGLLDSLQDAGRYGYALQGININGPMDFYAMQVANALAGNPPNEAIIEMHFPAAVLKFSQPCLMALSGADFGAVINGQEIAINKPVLVPKDAVLSFKERKAGSSVCLAVMGGFVLKPWLGSVSTNLVAGVGGLKGTKLMKNDMISLKREMDWNGTYARMFSFSANTTSAYMDAHYFYFIKGPEWDWLCPQSQHIFLQDPFTIAPQSDRMAIRLNGAKMTGISTGQLVSSAVAMGTIQLLPSGEILVLMADHQTTGGYPRIGNIITAHLPKLAQAGSGDAVHLLHIEQHTAEDLLTDLLDELQILQAACKFLLAAALEKYFARLLPLFN